MKHVIVIRMPKSWREKNDNDELNVELLQRLAEQYNFNWQLISEALGSQQSALKLRQMYRESLDRRRAIKHVQANSSNTIPSSSSSSSSNIHIVGSPSSLLYQESSSSGSSSESLAKLELSTASIARGSLESEQQQQQQLYRPWTPDTLDQQFDLLQLSHSSASASLPAFLIKSPEKKGGVQSPRDAIACDSPLRSDSDLLALSTSSPLSSPPSSSSSHNNSDSLSASALEAAFIDAFPDDLDSPHRE
jgi:hypothetical protein